MRQERAAVDVAERPRFVAMSPKRRRSAPSRGFADRRDDYDDDEFVVVEGAGATTTSLRSGGRATTRWSCGRRRGVGRTTTSATIPRLAPLPRRGLVPRRLLAGVEGGTRARGASATRRRMARPPRGPAAASARWGGADGWCARRLHYLRVWNRRARGTRQGTDEAVERLKALRRRRTSARSARKSARRRAAEVRETRRDLEQVARPRARRSRKSRGRRGRRRGRVEEENEAPRRSSRRPRRRRPRRSTANNASLTTRLSRPRHAVRPGSPRGAPALRARLVQGVDVVGFSGCAPSAHRRVAAVWLTTRRDNLIARVRGEMLAMSARTAARDRAGLATGVRVSPGVQASQAAPRASRYAIASSRCRRGHRGVVVLLLGHGGPLRELGVLEPQGQRAASARSRCAGSRSAARCGPRPGGRAPGDLGGRRRGRRPPRPAAAAAAPRPGRRRPTPPRQPRPAPSCPRPRRERLLCQSVAVRVEGDRLARCGVLGVLQACREASSSARALTALAFIRSPSRLAMNAGGSRADMGAGDHLLLGRDLRVGGHCCGSAVCRGAK